MSDAEIAVESKVAPEVQKQAEQMGWIPPSRFRGDPERFIDADTYIKRGEEVLPIVREQNKRLHTELDALRVESTKTQAALKGAQAAIDQMEERHVVATQKAVEAARKGLKSQLAAAAEAGDYEGVAELTDQLTSMVPVTAPKPAPPPPPFAPPPELTEWNSENPWFGQDKRKTALALAIAEELRTAGDTSQGRTFFEKVGLEVNKTLGVQEPRGDKVEGARGAAEERQSSGKGKGYAGLPADAKAACDADARNFVGDGKRYKTQADWRNRYAELYFGE